MPTLVAQGVFSAKIAGLIAFDFLFPPCAAGFWHAEVGAVFMPVPEAAVDEDNGAVFRQDKIGFAGQGFVLRSVHREAVAEAVEHRAQG